MLGDVRHVLELSIHDEAGRPIDRGWVTQGDPAEDANYAELSARPRDPGDRSLPYQRKPLSTRFERGALILRQDEPFEPMAVGAPGRAAVLLRAPEGRIDVTLRPPPRIRIEIDLGGVELPEGVTLVARCAPPGDDRAWFRFGPDYFEELWSGEFGLRLLSVAIARDEATALPILATGRVDVWLAAANARSPSGWSTLIGAAPHAISIAESREDQLFRLAPDPADLARAIAAAR